MADYLKFSIFSSTKDSLEKKKKQYYDPWAVSDFVNNNSNDDVTETD